MVGWPVLLAVALGLLGGGLAQRWVASRAYRYDDELDRPTRPVWWLAPVAALAAGAVARPHAGQGWVVLLLLIVAAVGGVTLAAIDLDVHRLPDAIQLPAYPLFALGLGLASLQSGDRGAWVRGVLACAVVFGFFLVVHLVPRSGLGFGDVKLLGLIGLLCGWFGWLTLLTALYAGVIIGGLSAAVLLVLRRANRHTHLAYGPALVAGALLALATG